jgi:Fungal specific transcription factor domain
MLVARIQEELQLQDSPDTLGSPGTGEEDIFQTFRKRGTLTDEPRHLNDYVTAYFTNVHPLLPVLHKESFLRLYRLFSPKALGVYIRHHSTPDASSREGRAVCLISSVLALGSVSLVENRLDSSNQSRAQPYYFTDALGFFNLCQTILAYTHDTFESMLAYLLMVSSCENN